MKQLFKLNIGKYDATLRLPTCICICKMYHLINIIDWSINNNIVDIEGIISNIGRETSYLIDINILLVEYASSRIV